MKTFKNMAAQGDFVIIRIKDIPDNVVPMKIENGTYVVAHSETGHNHVMVAERTEAYIKPDVAEVDLYEMFLNVKDPTEIVHLRQHDTHETIVVPPGNYVIKRQRQHTPEGFRRVQD